MKQKCTRCGCATFDVAMIATDQVRYSASIYTDGGIDTESTIKDSCGETAYDYSVPIKCYDCGHELSWSEADPTGYAEYQFCRDHWAEDPDHPVEDWQAEVAANDTRLGYHAWVINQQAHNRSNPEEATK